MRTFILTLFLLLASVGYAQDRPVLSKKHGLYEKSFKLTMKPSVEGREIRYTTDGSLPTINSKLYRSTLAITKTTLIRASEVIEGDSLSPATTASYLFISDILTQANDASGNPIIPEGYPDKWGPYADIKGTAPAYYAMDKTLVDLAPELVQKGLKELPIVSVVTDKDYLFSHDIDEERGGIYIYTGAPIGPGTGRDWERPVSMELIGGLLNHDVTVDCGIKLHGGHSRLPEKNPKHAFRLMFKGKYGAKKLRHPVFGEEGVDVFEDLVLRTYFGNSWEHWDEGNRTKAQYTRDLWARSVQERLGRPNSKGQPVHLFLNGMYWGMYNLCERINKDHCVEHFGGEKEDWDVIKVEETEGEKVVASDGDLVSWKEMLAVVNRVTDNDNDAYYQLQGLDEEGMPCDDYEALLDVESFCDYMLINFYGGNTDWDHHNWYAIRNKVDPGKGFQFICWDTELIFGSRSENVTNNDHSGKPSRILNCLMRNSEFRHLFNHRAHVLLTDEGGWLTEQGVREVWDSLYYNIENALYDESARWGDYRRDIHPYTAKGHRYRVDTYYQNERTRLLSEYFPVRTGNVISQLKNKGWYSDEDALPALKTGHLMASTAVYDLQGRLCGTLDQQGHLPVHLPSGLYVVANRKVRKP